MDVWELCLPDPQQMECIASLEETLTTPLPSTTTYEAPRAPVSSKESTLIAALNESERKCR